MRTKIKPNKLNFISLAFSLAFIAAGITLQVNTERIIRESRQANKQAIESFQIHNQVQNIIKDVIVIENRVRGLIITGDNDFLTGVQDTMVHLKNELIGLQNAAMNENNRTSFTRLASFIDKKALEGFTVTQDVVYAQPGVKKLKYDVFAPNNANNLPCIVFRVKNNRLHCVTNRKFGNDISHTGKLSAKNYALAFSADIN